MDWVSCKIALSGDTQNVVYRDPTRPVSWPEVGVIQYLHGDDAVYDVEFVRSEPTTSVDEKERLSLIYTPQVVDLIYPGRRPVIDGNFPGEKGEVIHERAKRKPAPRAERGAGALEV
jgi:hypothetical protein